jgi:site-specific DNA-adenine methylase
MAKYGIPYQGSKSKIAEKICELFPAADNFYDLFGGGFSITQCMLETRGNDFKKFHFNEIRPGVIELIAKAINGEYSYSNFKPDWITREEFFAKKESDPYIKICWAFGNDGRSYLFGKHIEEYKRSLHNAVVFNEFNDLAKNALGINSFEGIESIKERRLLVRQTVKVRNPTLPRGGLQQPQQLQQLLQLEQLQQLQHLGRLEQLQRLELYNLSYEQVPILENSIIYCDIPYENTRKYDNSFDKASFLNWVHNQKEPVFISEYEITDTRFKEVLSIVKRSLMSADKTLNNKIERVYANEAAVRLLNKGE